MDILTDEKSCLYHIQKIKEFCILAESFPALVGQDMARYATQQSQLSIGLSPTVQPLSEY